VADLYRERATTLVEMAESAHYLYRRPEVPDALRAQHLSPAASAMLKALAPRLEAIAWTRDVIAAALKSFAAEEGIKVPQVMMPLRVAVSGSASTPAVDAVLAVLGRERTLERLAALA
jgi:glutamyl-tRNA synthetase